MDESTTGGDGRGSRFVYRWRDELEQAPELTAADRHVALTIAGHMNGAGENAWPRIERIVDRTSLAKSTVIRSRAWLEEAGWLIVEQRSRREKNIYKAEIPSERKTRRDRVVWAEARAARLTLERAAIPAEKRSRRNRASRSQIEPTEQVANETHSGGKRAGRNRVASRSQSLPLSRSQSSPLIPLEHPSENPGTKSGASDVELRDVSNRISDEQHQTFGLVRVGVSQPRIGDVGYGQLLSNAWKADHLTEAEYEEQLGIQKTLVKALLPNPKDERIAA